MTDDDLRGRLHRADPAARLAPAAPDHVAGLVERATAGTTGTPARTAAAPRRPLIAVAAALVLLAAGVGLLVGRAPSHHAGRSGAAGTPSVAPLTIAGAAGKCVPPRPGTLAEAADFAFAGTVVGVDRQVVTLRVTHSYRGTPADQVQVRQTGETSEELVGPSGTFQQGEPYLVASAGGQVMICGYSGAADAPGLQQLYDDAF